MKMETNILRTMYTYLHVFLGGKNPYRQRLESLNHCQKPLFANGLYKKRRNCNNLNMMKGGERRCQLRKKMSTARMTRVEEEKWSRWSGPEKRLCVFTSVPT